jgi:hypothetical protein
VGWHTGPNMNLQHLRNLVARFLRAHNMARHFRSLQVWENLWQGEMGPSMPQGVSDALSQAARQDWPALWAALASSPEGLAGEQVPGLRARGGENAVAAEGRPPWWRHLLAC